MASNFQRPQLGQAQLTGAQIGNAPTVDRAAHARADQISSNIDALNNIGSTVVKKLSDAEKAQNQADRDEHLERPKVHDRSNDELQELERVSDGSDLRGPAALIVLDGDEFDSIIIDNHCQCYGGCE